MSIITKLLKIINRLVYTNETIILLKHETYVQQVSPAIVKRVTPENVTDVLYFQDQNKVKEFQRFLKLGDIGYYAYINDICIHRTWVVRNRYAMIHRFCKFDLRPNDLFIHFSETAPQARGQNIYPSVLATIANEFPHHVILVSVDSENTASIKSISKAGFKEICRIHLKIIFGIKKISADWIEPNNYDFS